MALILPPSGRTIKSIDGPSGCYGVLPALSLRWPVSGQLQAPESVLDYAYVAAVETLAGTDALTWAGFATSPSGTGEMVPGEVLVNGQTVIVWLSGGVAGRVYTGKLKLATASGRMFVVKIRIPIEPAFATWPLPAAPSTAFCAPVVWGATPPGPAALDFSDPANSGLIPTA